MEIKLKGGKKLKIKDISIDERDGLLDSVSYDYAADGKVLGVKMMHSTMTKWLRTCIDGDTSDKFLTSLSLDDTKIFSNKEDLSGKIFKIFVTGNLLQSINLKSKLFKILKSSFFEFINLEDE